MASALLTALPAVAQASSSVVGGVIDQVGGGIREWKQNDYILEQMGKQGEINRDNMKLKEELTEKEAQKLLDLELKKLELKSKLYKEDSGVDVDRYRQMSQVDMDVEKLKTEDELKLIQAKYGGQSDLIKLQMNQLNNQYQPTRSPEYNIYSTMGAYAPYSTNPMTQQFNYSQPYVPFRRIPTYRAGLTGHRIEST